MKASKQTITVCDELFGRAHHKSNKANAFRHAYWNILICQKTLKWTKNAQKSVIWTKKVTFLYEKVTQNDEIEKLMDLHNNEIGRIVFLDILGQKGVKIIDLLQKMMKNAQKTTKIEDFKNYTKQLVFIEDL